MTDKIKAALEWLNKEQSHNDHPQETEEIFSTIRAILSRGADPSFAYVPVNPNRHMLDCFAKGKTKEGISIYVLLKENDLDVYDILDGLKRAIAAAPATDQPIKGSETI